MPIRRLLLPALILALSHATCLAQAVTNIRAAQRAGTNLVDIDYDITGTAAPLHISLEVSTDDGATFTIPATSVSGAAGPNITPAANLRLTWDAGKDWGGRFSETMRYKVVADDDPPPEGFALIPAGPFQMGDQSSPLVGDSNELPVHTVNVSAFYMAKYEVTKALWDSVRTWGLANGYTDLPAGSGKAANHPVHSIRWYDMVKWCNARSQKEGLTPCYTIPGAALYKTGNRDDVACDWSANGYRLPTEAEWEKAARGEVVGKNFPWGADTITHSQANYNSSSAYSYNVSPTRGYHPTYYTGSSPYTSPVGSFAPNGYGLYDMAGNMREWCWDWHGSYAAGSQTDPRGPSSGTRRENRGGSWAHNASTCRLAYRPSTLLGYPNSPGDVIGFRLARSSVPSEMVLIAAGEFQMGDQSSPPVGMSGERPVHTVFVSAFFMAKHEVTKELWDDLRVWGLSNGYTDLAAGNGSYASKGASHPVHSISWYDMVKWCNARSEREGLTPCYTIPGAAVYKTGNRDDVVCNWSANGYRLPTEAEWEKAARGGAVGKNFPWGTDTISHSQANFSNDGGETYQNGTTGYHPLYGVGSEPYTSPVGSFAPNGYRLYDMAGNMWERCWDWYEVYALAAQTDPRGPSSGSSRVFRGGSWAMSANRCRIAARSISNPAYTYNGVGFRVARSSVP